MAEPDSLKVYKELAEVPVFKRAHLAPLRSSPNLSGNSSLLATVELETKEHRQFQTKRSLQDISLAVASKNWEFDVNAFGGSIHELPSEIVYSAPSPSGKKVVILRKTEDKGKTVRSLQIRKRTSAQYDADLDVTDVHGDFIANDTFGFPTWNDNETMVAYTAEARLFDDKAPEHVARLAKHRWVPSFGEQLADTRAPAIFLCEIFPLQAATVHQVTEATSESFTVFCQPAFGPSRPDEVHIVCTGLSRTTDGRRLGLVYCQNRPSSICEIRTSLGLLRSGMTVSPVTFEQQSRSARSPRTYGDYFVYLSNPVGEAHASCSSLHYWDFAEPEEEPGKDVVIGPMDEPLDHGPPRHSTFPGLYVDQLPVSCFVTRSRESPRPFIVTSTIWGSQKVPVAIDIAYGGADTLLEKATDAASYEILATDGKRYVLASRSTPISLPELVIADMWIIGQTMAWKPIKSLEIRGPLTERIAKLEYKIIRDIASKEEGPTEVILVKAKGPLQKVKSPLIVEPHGGPHSATVTQFSPSTLATVLCGFAVASVNYPGSLGFGQRWIDFLRHKLGKADVHSTYKALQHLIRIGIADKDPRKCLLRGGSHGGFIIAHLTSRYPDAFGAAILRNPVIDFVGTGSGGSDIPDWTFAEANLPYPVVGSAPPSSIAPTAYDTLRDLSPISHVSQVKTPSLLLLGAKDLRVSHQQGLAWAHGLRATGTPAEVMLFEGGSHPLSGVEAALTCFQTSLDFFSRYCALDSKSF